MEVTENNLYWAKVKENAIIPTKIDENAGYDVYACFDEDYMMIKPHETVLVPTGIASAVSSDYYLQVHERGSTGSKGIKCSAGVIDSGYRGEIFIAITNANNIPVYITKDGGKRIDIYPYTDAILYSYDKAIAQIIVHNVPAMNAQEITYEDLQLFDSDRNDGSLGSTNK